MYKKGSKHKLATNYISTNGTWPNEVRKIECTTPEFPGSNTFIIGKGSYLIGCAFSRMQPSAMVLIGNYCSMGRELCLMIGMDHDYHSASTFPFHVLTSGEEGESFPSFQPSSAWPSGMLGKKKDWIVIGNDVWIGAKTTILGGVHIGNGAVIGANTVIAKDVPPYSVVVGNPQRVIKYRFSHDIIQKLQSIKWWYWPTEELVHVHAAENEAAVHEFVKCYYKEQTPIKNEFTMQMENWRKDGMKLYYFRVPENDPSLYSHVCKKFLQAYAKHSKMRLLVEIPSGNPSLRETLMGSFVTLLSQSLQLSSAQAEKFQKTKFPLLFCEIKNKEIPLKIFPNIDYFLITQDFFSLIYIDFAKDNDVNLLYAYDLHLFED